MNRELIVTLLQKNIQELELITQGFMEMTAYPMPIIVLAQRKTDDIQLYIKELSLIKADITTEEIKISSQIVPNSTENEIEEINTVEDAKIETLNTIESIKELIADTITEDNEAELVEDEIEIAEIEAAESTEEVTVNEVEAIELEDVHEQDEVMEPIAEIKEITIPEPVKVAHEEVRKTILGERNISNTHTRNETLSKTDNSISSTLANKKVTDIKQAISIGDRFRFQRELFRGNGEDMNKTLTYINQLATLEEVLSFLQSKYGWVANSETAEDFYQIVKRRFS